MNIKEWYLIAREKLILVDGVFYWNKAQRNFKNKPAGTMSNETRWIKISYEGKRKLLKSSDIMEFFKTGEVPEKREPKYYWKHAGGFQVDIDGYYIGHSQTEEGAKAIVDDYFRNIGFTA